MPGPAWRASGFQLTAQLSVTLIVVVEIFAHAGEEIEDVVQVLTHGLGEISELELHCGIDVAVRKDP